jgi:hypothetical protein
MTTPIANIDNTTLLTLTVNLDIGDIADPALRLAYFQYLNVYIQTITTAFNAFVANGAVGTVNLADLAITSAKLADLAVQTGKIADLAVITSKINDLAITAAKIADGSITSAKIVDGTIVNADINAAAAIDGSKLANLSITSSQIADGTIMNVDINASAAIDASKIGAGTVSNTEFGYLDGVTGPIQQQLTNATLGAIADGSITDVKLDNGGTSVKAKANAALPSASYTAADVLTKIKTVDGPGSGLDADLLDGLNSTDFVNLTTAQTIGGAKTFNSETTVKMSVPTVTLWDTGVSVPVNNEKVKLYSFNNKNVYLTVYTAADVWQRDLLSIDKTTGDMTILGALTAGAGGSFANSKVTNGYQKLPGGLIFQWGVVNVAASSVVTQFNFPIVFPTNCLQLLGTAKYNGSVVSVSGFTATFGQFGQNAAVTVDVSWFAIGH